MAMVKVVSPSGWDFDRPIAVPIKISSRGLIGHDRNEFLKTASHVFLPFLDQIKVAADEEPVHVIALGASEAYGPNRNGDGFKEATCRECHHTFEKFARWYRNHQNKDPQKSYGYIKKSAYNDAMRRVELIAMLNREKSAAERNGGLIADQELMQIAKGENIPVSMACKVAYDVCSFCQNKAATRKDYCKAASCQAGGCSDNLTKLVKVAGDLHLLHVDNPNPYWFDLSKVWRPADRIAYGGPASYLTKSADDHGFLGVGGAKVAEDLGLSLPASIMLPRTVVAPVHTAAIEEQIKLAHGLAMLEANWTEHQLRPDTPRAFTQAIQGAADVAPLGEYGSRKCAEHLTALADLGGILPLRAFAELTKQAEHVPAASDALPGIYSRMVADGSVDAAVATSRYANTAGSLAGPNARLWATRHKEAFSLEKTAVENRCIRAALRGHALPVLNTGIWNEKRAADCPEADDLAREYSLYKLSALHRMANNCGDLLLTACLSAVQNQVI